MAIWLRRHVGCADMSLRRKRRGAALVASVRNQNFSEHRITS
jgi:hypothetical protein